jgi:hypothetical protein
VVVGEDSPAAAAPAFRSRRVLAVVNNGLGPDNQEHGLPVMICQAAPPRPVLLPSLTHFNRGPGTQGHRVRTRAAAGIRPPAARGRGG